jgi:ABC-type spermidine/putrescine transport system permease subunit I
VADVTVARAQREELLPLPAEAPAKAPARSLPALPRSLMILWAGMVLATAGFLVAGRLRIGAGNWIGRRMPAREIWSRYVDFLTDHGASGTLVFVVTAAAIATLVIAAFAFWLALALKDAPPQSAADTSAEM